MKKEDPEKFELQQKANAWETAQAEARVQAGATLTRALRCSVAIA